MPPHFWLWAFLVIGGMMVVYWWVAQSELAEQKGRVMAKQRAIAKELGPKIIPFRDKVEKRVMELAGPWPGDMVAPEAELEEVATEPSVYLRLWVDNASDPESIRKATVRSLHDGFTSCLFVGEARNPAEGPPCVTSADCERGLLCNEYDVCVPPSRPYNMRLAYRALRVLSSDWTDELHEASSELGVTAYDRDLEAVTERDVPIAAEILVRAKYFVLVLDETPEAGLPKPLPDAGETEEERVQRVPHYARIGIWDLNTDEQLLRLRTTAGGTLVAMGKVPPQRAELEAAKSRQVNSCALALAVKEALQRDDQGDAGIGGAPPVLRDAAP